MFMIPLLYRKSDDTPVIVAEGRTVLPKVNPAMLMEIKKLMVPVTETANAGLLCEAIHLHSEMEDAKDLIEENGGTYQANSEGYCISIDREIHVWAESEAGILFAISTLRQMHDAGQLTPALVYDYPRSSLRGYRVFIPGRDQIDQFKRTIDLMVYYKYNVLMLEIGGAMEYKRHPEINEKWEEYCRYLAEFPNKCSYHRNKYNFVRNSAHPDNGNGSFLTQAEIKELIAYCTERGIEIIPEVPGLSHSDYLVLAHPEIGELHRAKGYGDTYCPSNPASYALMFDVLDEIIEVFHPRAINIDRDEYVTVGKCPRCKGKDPVDLYVGDILKIYEYLKQRNIHVILEGDRLISVGGGLGYNRPGEWDYVPALASCRERLPKDMTIVNWYARFGEEAEKPLRDLGYQFVYGNFRPTSFVDWTGRTERSQVAGAMSASWTSWETDYLLRTCQIYDLLYAALLFWSHTFDDSQKPILIEKAAAESFRYFNTYFLPHSPHLIQITHSTDYFVPIKYFCDGEYIDEKQYALGDYIVMYEDGTTVKLPVVYGKNISNCNLKMDGSDALLETVCTAQPVALDKMYYRCIFDNPCPDKTILSISFLKKLPAACKVYIKEIRF